MDDQALDDFLPDQAAPEEATTDPVSGGLLNPTTHPDHIADDRRQWREGRRSDGVDTYVVISNNSVTSEECHYKFQPGDGKAIQTLLDRPIEPLKLNPLPLAISEVLAKGAIRTSDRCGPREAGADSSAPSARTPAQ